MNDGTSPPSAIAVESIAPNPSISSFPSIPSTTTTTSSSSDSAAGSPTLNSRRDLLSTVHLGQWVFLKASGPDRASVFGAGESYAFYAIKAAHSKKKIKLGKTAFVTANSLLGKKYASLYTIEDGILSPFVPQSLVIEPRKSGNDNRNLVDDNCAQSLTNLDVAALKEKGGKEVVKALIEHSATFSSKTVYAQEKYLQKKKNKHSPVFQLLPANVASISQYVYFRSPQTIGYLRWDSIARLLYLSNLQADSNALVIDFCDGLLTGAVRERISSFGSGSVTNLFLGSKPKQKTLSFFENSLCAPLKSINILGFLDQKPHSQPKRYTSLIVVAPMKFSTLTSVIIPILSHLLPACCFSFLSSETSSLCEIAEMLRRPILLSSIAGHDESDSDSHEYFGVANMQLNETWFREYQILPMRTHPMVNMHSSSGYILTGIVTSFVNTGDSACKTRLMTEIAGQFDDSTSKDDLCGAPPRKKMKIDSL